MSSLKVAKYIKCKGHDVAHKTSGLYCLCSTEAFSDFENEKLMGLQEKHNGMPKNEHDTFLMGLIESKEVAR